ncbi:LGFP repeat-containing protein [Amnibacterium endophyticum]|uniref:LGFP repeat-containing protein n=1 Tax=Amnibacterium endophyticum TaxID=2109337 RepID=A0ABW4LDH4_9MICO
MTAPARRSLVKRFTGAGLAMLIIGSGLTAIVAAEQPASAATATEMLRGFDPADIISDGVMFNPSTMSAAAIQTFLNGKVATCRSGYTCLKDYRQDTTDKAADPMCKAYTGRKAETAAQIISRVGAACGVNPQVLLVTLQKEQSLVTDTWPGARQYRSATGYGCPDTAPCDSDYYGFFNQVYKAAWAFKRYTSPPGTEGAGWTKFNWFPVGKATGVLFHPNAACGARSITIKNKATAVLYYFTPYQPNAAALAAGFGIGDSCSAYGNRNFFLYFTSWFGSTHYAVSSGIAAYWRSTGGTTGSLGEPLANAKKSSAAGGGITQRFTRGTVYSSAAGTATLRGASLAEYTSQGGPAGALGWPTADAVTRKDHGGGKVQAFQHGAVFAGAAGAFAVTGGVYDRYDAESFQAGDLGWPTADAVTSQAGGGGVWQAFQGGRIAVTPKGSNVVTGTILAKWLQRGAEAGSLGWPTADAGSVTANGRTGIVQQFATGRTIVLGRKVYTVTGDLYRNWRSHGSQAGSLGWPRGAAVKSAKNGGGWSQVFEKGAVLYSDAARAHYLNGKEYALYVKRGGTDGSLGWPGARVRSSAGTGGYITPFTNGAIYRSKRGTVAVVGFIGVKYRAKGGPSSVLGWPTGAAKREKGVMTQRFEGGRISWTAAGGARASRR